jgi:glycosyltransferase involved in cell wall biosynthesis
MSKPPVLVMANHIDGLGGAERVAHILAAGLADRGYEVALRGIRPTAEHRMAMDDARYSTAFMSRRAERPASEKPWPVTVRRAMHREAVRNLEQTLTEYRTGVFICMQVFVMEHVAEIGIDRVIDAGTRTIGQYHSSYEAAHTTSDFGRISKVYRKIDKFLLLTPEDAEAFVRHNFNNTGWIPNPLSMYPARINAPREKRLVAVARYDEIKQLDHALRAWSAVSPDFPDWKFELYGEGPARTMLQETIDGLGIGRSTRLMGVTDDVEALLLRSSLSVLCSRFEGLPMTLAESLACGVPAVTYDCSPGVRAIVTDGETGRIVSPNHVDGLAAALRELMADEPRRRAMGAAARDSAKRFAVDTVMDRWEETISRLIR